MKKMLLMIINPRSGRNKINDDLLEATNIFGMEGYGITVLNTTKAGDATEYAREFGKDYDIVICRGGDGTFCEMMNGIMSLDKKPLIGYIPAGTTNDLGNTLSLPMKARKAAQLIVSEDALPYDIGTFNGKYFTYVASFGALTECSYAAPQSLKNKIGRFAYFYEAAKEIKDIHPIPLRVKVDDQVFEGEYIFGSISNSYVIAKVIHLDPELVCLNDGKFEVLLVENPRNVKGWATTLTSAVARKFDERYIKLVKGSHIEIETLDGSPLPWTLDGEYGGDDNKVVIDIKKHAFNMFRPVQKNEDTEEATIEK
ncbi:MAG: YegS/Rv2252/BmrU family lipid kinase [Clostridia bacterium]|nr:YegS/Rv2252/BmrU family lipid kinase [Clostridia bacterium]